jgi:hypothetical protein
MSQTSDKKRPGAIFRIGPAEKERCSMHGTLNGPRRGRQRRQHLKVRKRAELVQAYRNADPADRIALGKTVGVDHVFDETSSRHCEAIWRSPGPTRRAPSTKEK